MFTGDNLRLTITNLFTGYAPLDDSPKCFSWFLQIYICLQEITLDLRLPIYSPVTLRWMILQNFPLGSDMSPGREKPTAGADVLAAMRGTVACC